MIIADFSSRKYAADILNYRKVRIARQPIVRFSAKFKLNCRRLLFLFERMQSNQNIELEITGFWQ